MTQLPTGTVTFLFTDIEGSTRLLSEAADAYRTLLEDHRRLIRVAVERHEGAIFGTEGDAVFAAFGRAVTALGAAAEAQRALGAHRWPANRQVRVRAGVHSGEVTLTDGDYVGLAVHEVARISAAAHGGQILVSGTTRELAADAGLRALGLRDLGEHRLKDISHPVRIYQLVGDGLLDEFPPPRTPGSRPNNLPEQLTSFVGRRELDEGERLLAGTRLLTLTGPGGTGKTRLGLQLAAEAGDAAPDGVFFVPLDAVRDPTVVPSAIVAAVGLPDAGSSGAAPPLTRLADHLQHRAVLLVLDNFEQVIDAAPIVAELLGAAPNVKVIVTSRIPLRIRGEQELPIPPLGVPERSAVSAAEALQSAAVVLFVERVTAVRPDFRLTDENAASIVDIVRRLDGLPLAIELAAARTRVLSTEALAERLDQRLATLTGGARDLPARQQTLRHTIDWSYELLELADRALFERFSVFASGACLVEAETVCGPPTELGEEVLDGLVSLSEKSLMRPVPHAVDEPRFAMLATIREYAADRLVGRPDAEALRQRHAEAYLALVEGAAPHLLGPRQRRLLDRLEQDHDNLRQALDWAIERGEAGFGLRFLVGIWRFWQIRGYLTEGWDQAQRVLALPDAGRQPPALRARALGGAGSIAYWRADGMRTHELYRDALDLARSSGDPAILAEALTNFGFASRPETRRTQSVYVAGRPYFEEAVGLYRELDDRDGLANATWALASSYMDTREFDTARGFIEESLTIYRETDNRFGTGWALWTLAFIEFRTDRFDKAIHPATEALRVFADGNDLSGIAMCLFGMALGAREIGAKDSFWRLAGVTDTFITKLDVGIDPDVLRSIGLEPFERPADDPDAQGAWDAGATMTVEEAVSYGLALAPTLSSALALGRQA
jgi:predicted ATPase/class 3 adenylate cyclase